MLGGLNGLREHEMFGRDEELSSLADSLQQFRQNPTAGSGVALITGGPGEGKSRLAAEVLARMHSGVSFSAVHVVDLGSREQWASSARTSIAAEKLLGARTGPVGARAAVLYENAEDIIQAGGEALKVGAAVQLCSTAALASAPLRAGLNCCPPCPLSHATQAFIRHVQVLSSSGVCQIITSRVLVPDQRSQGWEPVRLDGLSPAAAEQLLEARCPELPAHDRDYLWCECTNNALLLQLLGGFLATGRITMQVRQGSCWCRWRALCRWTMQVQVSGALHLQGGKEAWVVSACPPPQACSPLPC